MINNYEFYVLLLIFKIYNLQQNMAEGKLANPMKFENSTSC